jgi:two-component system NtrC family response regulator
MEPFAILIVDDEAPQRLMIRGFLRKQGFQVRDVGAGDEALQLVQHETFDLVIADYKMPAMSGIEVLKGIKQINPEIPVVILTAYGTVDSAVEAMKAGAYDYLSKPVDLDELLHLIHRVRERQRLVTEVRELRQELVARFRFDQIVGTSGKMQEVLSLVARVSQTQATVLIRGESGTGKELIARAIHYNSKRRDGPFIKVNLAALPDTLLESELFGHEKGAFTGAMERRIGRFEAADRGSIFLDEIGDLSLNLQVKLLRVLQEREFERLGSNRPIRVDIRVLAATNQDLEAAVQAKRFREDLYYRLNVLPIFLPPLRERREDIPLLIEHLLEKFCRSTEKEVRSVSREAMDALMKYDYPGNVRELENILERAVILARHDTILLEDLPLYLQQSTGKELLSPATADSPLPEVLANIEKQLIQRALERHAGVQVRAAEELGISERVLRYKMHKYGL